jgi:hypothetical protein
MPPPVTIRNAKYCGELPPAAGTAEHREWVGLCVLALLIAVGAALVKVLW